MQATYPRPDKNGSGKPIRNIGLGVVVAAALVALLVAAYTVGYDKGKPDQPIAKSSQPPAAGGGGQAKAKKSFVESCGGCHVLKAAGTKGASGPNLDDLKADAKTTADQIIKGGGSMPAGILQGADAQAVAQYIAQVAGK